MNSKILIIITLISITLLGGFLRFYEITKNPPSLNGDEVSMGYDAYSILQTGKDQFGKFMPITFRSVGDYKNPVPIYLMIPSIKLFGLNDFSVRLQNALIGTLMIPFLFLFLVKVIKDKLTALLGAFFLSISSWHIYYSRVEYETLIASFFILLGIWFFMKMFEGLRIWAVLSAFFLILTMYTAPAPRLFVPVFIIAAIFLQFSKFKTRIDKLITFIFTCILLVLPLVYATIFLGAGTRLTMVLISNDIEFQRYVLLSYFSSLNDLPLLVFFWLKRYISYFQPEFLFFNGLNMTTPGNIGLGLFYLFELPLLFLGIIEFIKRKIPYKAIFVIWLLAGIVPDSITNNQQHAGRLLQITPVAILIISLGAIRFFKLINSLSKIYIRFAVLGIFIIFAAVTLIHAFLIFSVHFPRAKGESYDEGLREAVFYVQKHQDKYKEVIFDPRRGIEGPYLISNPYLYLLFYTKYDPHTYQIEPKVVSGDKSYFLKFNKYTFRNIDWLQDGAKKNTLLIGSPWSFPENGLKEGELLEKIYMTNGHPAYYIVSPKTDHNDI